MVPKQVGDSSVLYVVTDLGCGSVTQSSKVEVLPVLPKVSNAGMWGCLLLAASSLGEEHQSTQGHFHY